jgi:hypothetical protein
MKYLLPLFALLLLISCNSEPKKKSTPVQNIPLKERPIPPLPGSNASNSVVGGAHYICPKNCIGGTGAAAGACSVCQTEMAHNQGFHATQNNNIVPGAQNPAAASTGDLPNASGQYHYTCQKGCTGGKGGAGSCASCGETLAHNQAYHI